MNRSIFYITFGSFELFTGSKSLRALNPLSILGIIVAFIWFMQISGCDKEPEPTPTPKPIAAFLTNADTFAVDEVVIFTNESQHATSYLWDFGNGETSIQENPQTVYSSRGQYNVVLRVENESGNNTILKKLKVMDYPELDIKFSRYVFDREEPIYFSNNTVDVQDYQWDFGDGFTTNEENPSHAYSDSGKYTVKVTGTNFIGSSTDSAQVTILDKPLIGKWNLEKVELWDVNTSREKTLNPEGYFEFIDKKHYVSDWTLGSSKGQIEAEYTFDGSKLTSNLGNFIIGYPTQGDGFYTHVDCSLDDWFKWAQYIAVYKKVSIRFPDAHHMRLSAYNPDVGTSCDIYFERDSN